MGAIDTDHQYRRERCDFNSHPHQTDIVCHQREIHGEHQHLVHRMIEAYGDWRQPADLNLVADIARAENTGGEGNESGQDDEDPVEVVHQQIIA